MKTVIAIIIAVATLFAANNDIDDLQNKALAKLIVKYESLKAKIDHLENALKRAEWAKNLYMVKTVFANIREKPGIDHKVIKVYHKGDLIKIDGFKGNWAHLYNGGYIHKSLIAPVLYK